MAFLPPATLGLRPPRHARLATHPPHHSARTLPRAAAPPPDDDTPPRGRPFNFQPFDGSQPLLPPWRPPTLEADFTYVARRIVSREAGARAAPSKRVVMVQARGAGTLFAEVVQEVPHSAGGTGGKLWLRPLLLDGEGETFVDLRGGSDVFVSDGVAREVDGEMKVRIAVNLAATEADVAARVLEDGAWKEAGGRALLAFMQRLAEAGKDGR